MSNTSFNVEVATRYLSASATTYSLYDHILTLDREVRYIWSGKFGMYSFFFIFNRYGVECGLLYACYIIGGFRGELQDSTFFRAITFLTIALSLSNNIYTTIHHYTLWERRKAAMYTLWAGIVIAYVPAIVFGTLFILQHIDYIVYVEDIGSCVLLEFTNQGRVFYVCMVAFDVFALIVIVVNALHRPYRKTSDVISGLRRDGVTSFVTLMFLRIILLAVVCALPSTEIFLVFLNVWALISIIYARIMLKVERVRWEGPSVHIWVPSSEAFELMPSRRDL